MRYHGNTISRSNTGVMIVVVVTQRIALAYGRIFCRAPSRSGACCGSAETCVQRHLTRVYIPAWGTSHGLTFRPIHTTPTKGVQARVADVSQATRVPDELEPRACEPAEPRPLRALSAPRHKFQCSTARRTSVNTPTVQTRTFALC